MKRLLLTPLCILALAPLIACAEEPPVTFRSSYPDLHDSAVEKIQRHFSEYAPGFEVLANSGDYNGLIPT